MKTLYSAHLPGSLGLLVVTLVLDETTGNDLLIEYRHPQAETSKVLPSLQDAVDLDLAGDPLIERLNYAAFLNGIVVGRIRAALKEIAAEDPPDEGGELAPRKPASLGLIPITVENIHELPEKTSPELRRQIHARLGIADPLLSHENEQ